MAIFFSLTGTTTGAKLKIQVGTFSGVYPDSLVDRKNVFDKEFITPKGKIYGRLYIEDATVFNSGTELFAEYSAEYLCGEDYWTFDNDSRFALKFLSVDITNADDITIYSSRYNDNEAIPWTQLNYTQIKFDSPNKYIHGTLYGFINDKWNSLLSSYLYTGYLYQAYTITNSFGGPQLNGGQIGYLYGYDENSRSWRADTAGLSGRSNVLSSRSMIYDSSTGNFNLEWSGHKAKLIGLSARFMPSSTTDSQKLGGYYIEVLPDTVTPKNFYTPYRVPTIMRTNKGKQVPPFAIQYTQGGVSSPATDYGDTITLFNTSIDTDQISTDVYNAFQIYHSDATLLSFKSDINPMIGLDRNDHLDINVLLYYLLFEKAPDENLPPYPQIEPEPDKPPITDPENPYTPPYGGDGQGDDTSEYVEPPSLPTVNITELGLVNIYKLTRQEASSLSYYLWNNADFTRIKEFFSNPVDAIISFSLFPMRIDTVKSNAIVLGNVQTDVIAGIVENNWMMLDWGALNIPEYYGDYSDYSDTRAELFLPFIGRYSLNIYDIMDSELSLIYNIDILSGNATAVLSVKRNKWNTNLQAVIGEYSGVLNQQLPLSSLDNSALVSSFIGLAQGQLTLPKETQKTISSITASNGMLGSKIAYIAIERPIHYITDTYAHNHGFPYESTMKLGLAKGFTIAREIFLNGQIIGSNEETTEIVNLLSEGVIF